MIKLSRLTDYAVVIMAELTKCKKNQLLSASALSDRTGIPEPTVSKILKILVKNGLIISTRGINGGYQLKGTAKDLQITSVIEAIEGPILLTSCVSGSESDCALESQCSLKGRWTPVNVAIKSALSSLTLADLVD
jgi:FeS assembly SUF system regulator